MKVPLNWLKDYVDIKISTKELAEALTMSGSKVEGIEVQGEEISKVVVGKILALEKHPDADRLLVSKVDVGSGIIQIVTGAQNVKVGDYVPIALDGAALPGGKTITRGRLRGVESEGMMCSIQELALTRDDFPDAAEDGIFIINDIGEQLVPGTDVRDVLGLNETVVEFEITSNRPDCLSMIGIAREAAATLESSFRKPSISVMEEEDDASGYASVQIDDPDLCPRYTARIIKDVRIGPSPKWMRDRLRAAGVRPINNIVDITNYIMLELGQPMHAFDLENLEGKKVVVRRARDGEILKTLDGQERKLDPSMLVIADAAKPVGVAGVMGGADSEITEKTRTILFESANFHGISIRLTAKKLGMRTEASGRFEKGLDVENAITAVNRAAQLVEEIGAGRVCKGVIDCYAKRQEPRKIRFRSDRINSLLGTSIAASEMADIFKALELKLDEASGFVEIPSFRLDIEGEADLAEEVARFFGYNNIEPTLLAGKAATIGKKTFKQKVEDIVKNTMISCGLSEIYTYSFTSPRVFDRIRLPEDSPLRRALIISNPLGEEYSVMRTTTIPDMLLVIGRNYSRQTDQARLFELSCVYLPKDLPVVELPEEKQVLTLGMYGNVDFYDMKGVVEELFGVLRIEGCVFRPEKGNPVFHPGRTANIILNGQAIGVIGQVHPETAERFECPEEVYVGVIDFSTLAENASMSAQYRPLPKFPAVARDIAMVVRDDVMVMEIEDIIRKEAGKILEEVRLFDVYKGKQVPEGMKSVAYSITFRAEDRTLTDEEVNKAMDSILRELKNTLDAQLR